MGNWQVENAVVKCSLVMKSSVVLSLRVQQKVKILMNEYHAKEWLGYLVGEVYDDFIQVNDLIIPPHTVADTATAEVAPGFHPKGCIGILHSHHTMGSFHSGTDQDYVDGNYEVSVTASYRGSTLDYDTVAKCNTPCGHKAVEKVKTLLETPQLDFDPNEFLTEAKENIGQARQEVHVPVTIYGKGRTKTITMEDLKSGKVNVGQHSLEELSEEDELAFRGAFGYEW